ncbi:MAG: solute symporter family protein [Hyphomicrobiaceae bacterium]
MATTHRTRLINPRLGAYFSIFASAFAALFLLLLIFEQLGTSHVVIRVAVLFAPLLVFAAIGTATFTQSPAEFFAAGRRVPAVYNGLVLAISAIGGTGLIVATGLFFLNGFDAWCLTIGLCTGFVIMGTAVAPYMRKYGGYTVPSYLARRFNSRALRIASAAVFSVPILLLLTAELHMANYVVGLLTGLARSNIAVILSITLAAALLLGGLRGLGWVATAQAIAAIIAIIVPAAMLGVIETNLPLAQFSYGPVLRGIGRMEFAQQVPTPELSLFAFDLAKTGLNTIGDRMASPYGSIGQLSFAIVSLTVALGIACAPWLLPRCGTTVGVYEARKSLGWTVVFVGVVMMTLSALAVFLRNDLMRDLVGQTVTTLPEWFTSLVQWGKAAVNESSGPLSLNDFSFDRDALLFAVPLASDFPTIVLYLVFAGVLSAALAAAGATVYALATMLSEDIVHGLHASGSSPSSRILSARILVVVVIIIGLLFAGYIRTDPLQLLLWALAISASTAFPVVVLSIWWKRMSPLAALAGLIVGFGSSVFAILMGDAWWMPIPAQLVGLVGLVPAVCVIFAIAKLGPPPQRDTREAVRDLRIPGGETIFDREQRLLRLAHEKRGNRN